MTLHWWMHWFWVTTVITLHGWGTTAAPQPEDLQHITTDVEVSPPRPSERQGRAMYYTKTLPTTTPVPVQPNDTDSEEANTTSVDKNVTEQIHVDGNVTWMAANTTENTTEPNTTESQNATFATKKRNLTRPDFIKSDINTDAAESRIVTEKPLSLETTFLQTRIPPNIESSRRVIDPDEGGIDTGAIAGISFAALVLVALAGSTAFVLYRRRYLNKPQTLNDKCSNPDSSGYLDDSTIRDNSEEMYSLDNDSFLNSLEAMTIQNYWTDTVKHTKL